MPTCPICQRQKKRLVNDHCHRTGLSRGRLCSTCNAALGMYHDDVPTLQRAIDYLTYHHTRLADVIGIDHRDPASLALLTEERRQAAFLLARL